MCTRPAFRSRLSWARRTRTSFALWSASIRWSSERAGAWACVFDVTMSRTSLARLGPVVKRERFGRFAGVFALSIGLDDEAAGVDPLAAPDPTAEASTLAQRLGRELLAHPGGCDRVREQDRPERDRARSGGDELERVAPARHASHAHDGQLDGPRAGVHARERDRPERRPE